MDTTMVTLEYLNSEGKKTTYTRELTFEQLGKLIMKVDDLADGVDDEVDGL